MRYVNEHEAHEMFDEFLDMTNAEAEICGMTYTPSAILKECDPIAYRCTFNDWADAEGITTYEDEADDEPDEDA